MWSQQALALAACPSPLEPDYPATTDDLPANQARIGSNNATNLPEEARPEHCARLNRPRRQEHITRSKSDTDVNRA
jgi:hypothetical protein